jgi:lipoprotein-releasing system ATP-binding protein
MEHYLSLASTIVVAVTIGGIVTVLAIHRRARRIVSISSIGRRPAGRDSIGVVELANGVHGTPPAPKVPAAVVEFRGVSKRYGPESPWILREFNARLGAGVNVVVGPSGSGKTTFLHLLGGLDAPDFGEVVVRGRKLPRASESELCLYRRHAVSWIFQDLHLIGHQSALENAAFPLIVRGVSREEALREARRNIELVGLAHRAFAKPSALSGGEKQRVAIARAFVSRAPLIVADEPTGSLDPENADSVMRSLADMTRATGRSVVLVTHSANVVRYGDNVYRLERSGLRPVAVLESRRNEEV